VEPLQWPADFSRVPTQHLASLKGFTYVARLQLPLVAGKAGKPDFVRPPSGEQFAVYDPWLEYAFINGTAPCFTTEEEHRALELPPQDRQALAQRKCPLKWNAVSKGRVEPLHIIGVEVLEHDVCGSQRLKVVATLSPLKERPLFLTTTGRPGPVSWTPASELVATRPPGLLQPPLPDGVVNPRLTWHRYPGKSEPLGFLVETTADVWFDSFDVDKFGPDRWVRWQALFWVDARGARVLPPFEPHDQLYWGEDFRFSGLQDVNGDGEPDILVGDPLSLILERFEDGFRAWGFPFFPPGGC